MLPNKSTTDRFAVFLLVLYISIIAFYVIFMVRVNRETIIKNHEMLQALSDRKEYHIKICEENNRMLRNYLEQHKQGEPQ